MDLLLAAANSGALLLCVVFIAYVAAILAPLLHRKPELTGDPSKYRWHVLIPCCDEEAVIADTVKRLHRQGGWDGIWIIDDASTDRTAAIVHNLARKVPNLWLISRNAPNARKGKGAALNTGYRVLRSMLPPTSDLDKTSLQIPGSSVFPGFSNAPSAIR